uniref:Uncharacterized protein n=1 Tax=Glossina pallidipes TaxID=7398 RepID=A0A1A9ZQK5_GLOPL
MIKKLKGLLNNSNNSFASCIITAKTYSNEVNRKKEESEDENSESVSFQQQRKKQGSEEQQEITSTVLYQSYRLSYNVSGTCYIASVVILDDLRCVAVDTVDDEFWTLDFGILMPRNNVCIWQPHNSGASKSTIKSLLVRHLLFRRFFSKP